MQGVQLFTDTDGSVAQLHGIGVQRFGDRWYAYGEIRNDGNLFQGIACYSTTNFVEWRNEGTVLEVGDDQWHASRFLYVGDRWNRFGQFRVGHPADRHQ